MGYFINFPALPLYTNLDSIKSSFILFAWTHPPLIKSQDYNDHIRLTSDNMAEHKRSTIQRRTFIGGRHESITDVNSTIGIFLVFSQSLVKFDISDPIFYPLILTQMSAFADIYDPDVKSLHNAQVVEYHWIPHQIICYVQQYFQAATVEPLDLSIYL